MLVLSPDSCCDICLEQYSHVQSEAKGPASLGCGHTFCRSCLFTLATRVCPVCRQPFSITNDMRKLHVDLESRSSRDIIKYEMGMLESCRSGDLILMEEGILEVEKWLQSQSPGFRCSLPTVVELARLLMEATAQLHEALERSQMDEKSLKMRQELDSMKAAADRKRLQQETEALRVGMVRQRDYLALLESELVKARENTAAAAQVVSISQTPPPPPPPPPPPTPKARPALHKPPIMTLPLPTSNSPVITPRSSWVVIESPTESAKNSPPSTPVNRLQKAAPLLDVSSRTLAVTEGPVYRKPRSGLQGPRERISPTPLKPTLPPGAAPSAFSPVDRPSSRSQESRESLRSSSYESRRTSLPSSIRPLAQSASHSYEVPSRRQRNSAQPTSWRRMEASTSSRDAQPRIDEGDGSFLPYLQSNDSHEVPPSRPTRSQPPSTIDALSLSRKRALRRQSKDAFS